MLRAVAARAVATARAAPRVASHTRDADRRARSRTASTSRDAPLVVPLAPFCELLTRDTVLAADASRPLALVVGWFGAELRHVKKYASLYVDPGWDAVAVAPPSAATLVPAVADAYAEAVLEAVARRGTRTRVLVHVASNGGFIFAGNLMLKARSGDARARALFERTRGFVFDCAPGDLRPDIIARAAYAVLGGSSATTEPAPILETLAGGLLRLPSIEARLRAIDEVWGKGNGETPSGWSLPACPSLFLYSETDVLISPREIEAFARLREEITGERSYLHKYPDAAHCELGREHLDDYRDRLRAFVASIDGE